MQYIRPFPSLSATCDDIGGGRKAGSVKSLSIPQALNTSLHMQFLTQEPCSNGRTRIVGPAEGVSQAFADN